MTNYCQSCPFAACEDCRFQPTAKPGGPMNIWTALLLIACLMGIAFMTGPSWCEDSPFEDDPICAGADW